MELNKKIILERFLEINGGDAEDVFIYFAPGRVNLIGEHIDYNGGNVLPFSIAQGTYLAVRRTEDPLVKMKSANESFVAEVCLKHLVKPVGQTWVNYPLGVINEILNEISFSGGFQMYFSGNIPKASGLSSSASIEMVTAFALNDLFNLSISRKQLALICQKAENTFVGMPCGIMDQFAVGLGKKNKVINLNTVSLNYEMIDAGLEGYSWIITNSMKQRSLTSSKYNERRLECNRALQAINKEKEAEFLCDLSVQDYETLKKGFEDELTAKRAKHAIYENQRVKEMILALKTKNLKRIGELLNESHQSLRYDFEVSCEELDTLVDLAQAQKGVIGSRMTGAGFGGCTITLVEGKEVENVKKGISKGYKDKTTIDCEFYLAEISDGVRKL